MLKFVSAAGLGLAVVVLALPAAAAPDQRPPGLWETTTTDLTASGRSRVSTSRTCIARAEPFDAAFREDMGAACRYTRETVAGGRIDVAGVCPSGATSLVGAYTPTSLDVQLKGSLSMGKATLPLNLSIRSRRVAAACQDDDG